MRLKYLRILKFIRIEKITEEFTEEYCWTI